MSNVAQDIIRAARRYGIDPRAALAIAYHESGIRRNAVGDGGTSFGPFQLHIGGALPHGKGAKWAGSAAGIDYAVRQMAQAGARGLHGEAAISAISRRFERPANPAAEIQDALDWYHRNKVAIPHGRVGGLPTPKMARAQAVSALQSLAPIPSLPVAPMSYALPTRGDILAKAMGGQAATVQPQTFALPSPPESSSAALMANVQRSRSKLLRM